MTAPDRDLADVAALSDLAPRDPCAELIDEAFRAVTGGGKQVGDAIPVLTAAAREDIADMLRGALDELATAFDALSHLRIEFSMAAQPR